MILKSGLTRKDITGVDKYQRWYKPFDNENRVALIVKRDKKVNGKMLNKIDLENKKAIFLASDENKAWTKTLEDRILKGYQIELYVQESDMKNNYFQLNVSSWEITDDRMFIVNL
ncbi:hypothetical protein NSA45_04700 [Paraclostridium bifermentans]|uniref:hypothetical protein n=1 Tax=Paraclostridium bifermentans TaxID=1490 RepID=UPI002149A58D|nr:hypothetical protein [Paraclostridium bifermentans]MCR1875150.1 hypothetical protein [Paraclostridium bifermentans]